ncbi:unnamed protein product [Darwinula stevensoni]|uniref:Uncharacterized protein n=1 Tax=Darwinula stevensoni TaxID=69355 RepID=A0A7R9AII4_9CRUS|nr:unnamed protein product [Darwinula stevensoni]CAG0906798.1 unnamed protein product [Darwinula stevensoni]
MQALGTVNWIFSAVTSQQAFLTGLGTCITNNVANNAGLDTASQARYTACATSLSSTGSNGFANWGIYFRGYACIASANRQATTTTG